MLLWRPADSGQRANTFGQQHQPEGVLPNRLAALSRTSQDRLSHTYSIDMSVMDAFGWLYQVTCNLLGDVWGHVCTFVISRTAGLRHVGTCLLACYRR